MHMHHGQTGFVRVIPAIHNWDCFRQRNMAGQVVGPDGTWKPGMTRMNQWTDDDQDEEEAADSSSAPGMIPAAGSPTAPRVIAPRVIPPRVIPAADSPTAPIVIPPLPHSRIPAAPMMVDVTTTAPVTPEPEDADLTDEEPCGKSWQNDWPPSPSDEETGDDPGKVWTSFKTSSQIISPRRAPENWQGNF